MIDTLNQLALRLGDLLLGWLLALPSDVSLLALAIGSATILTLVRKFTTDQDLLRRCSQDKKRLGELLRLAKKAKDGDAKRRYQTTRGLVGIKQLRAEGKPLLVSLLPIALLATWAWQRMEFHPARGGEVFEFAVNFQSTAAGQIAHLVPEDGLKAENGWVQEITTNTNAPDAETRVVWRLRAEPRPQPYKLQVRFADQTLSHPVLVGQRTYMPPMVEQALPVQASEVKLQPVKLFGIVPGIPALAFAPWLVAYLIVVMAVFPLLKRIFKTY